MPNGTNGMDSHKDVPFGGFCLCCTSFRESDLSKTPIFLGMKREQTFSSQRCNLTYYQNYIVDRNQILHNDNEHQVLFVSGPNMPQTNCKMAEDVILNN